MKVYIITKEPFPNGMASTQRIKCYARAIEPYVDKIEILVYIRTEHGIINNSKVSGVLGDNIPFKYLPKQTMESDNILLKCFHYIFDRFLLLIFLLKNLEKGDVVFGYVNSDVRFSLLLIKVIHLLGCVYVRDLCEIPYGTGIESKSNVIKRKITYKKQFPLLDGVVSISDNLTALFKKYNKHSEVLKVPIMVDFDSSNLEDASSEEKPFIFHCGTLYEQKDGILGMIEAVCMANLKRENKIILKCTGMLKKSPHANQIQAIINNYNASDSVQFVGYLSDEELKENLAKASLVIINKYVNQQNTYCFSTKLAEYMAASKPIIITNVGEAMNWLTNNENAVIIPSGNVSVLANTINLVIDDLGFRKRIAKNANLYCQKHFDYKCYGKILVDYFKRIRQ